MPQEDREDFARRIRQLPSSSVVHIPVDQRERHAKILSHLLARMADGDEEACLLEASRTKLLLGTVPAGSNIRVELATRLRLWQSGKYAELLVRVEDQHRATVRRRSTRGAAAEGKRGQRARTLLREGAYSKATNSLHTDMADLDDAAQLSWGSTLLPRSTRPCAALASPEDTPEPPSLPDQHGSRAALRGVSFRAMSGAGPSGMRPEHLREMTAVRDRRISGSLLAAIDKFVDAAISGELCDAAKWILDSRLVFLRKKKGIVPRPIRVGELWRRVIAKRVIDANRKHIQKVCLDARQFGVAVPGGAEGLVHFRTLIENYFATGNDAKVIIDVDFKNAFPSLEWDSIRAAVQELLPDAACWTHWCHS